MRSKLRTTHSRFAPPGNPEIRAVRRPRGELTRRQLVPAVFAALSCSSKFQNNSHGSRASLIAVRCWSKSSRARSISVSSAVGRQCIWSSPVREGRLALVVARSIPLRRNAHARARDAPVIVREVGSASRRVWATLSQAGSRCDLRSRWGNNKSRSGRREWARGAVGAVQKWKPANCCRANHRPTLSRRDARRLGSPRVLPIRRLSDFARRG